MKLEELIKANGNKLNDLKMTLVTAESCTGGHLAYLLSANSEASSSLERGYITYSNQSKQELLNVSPETLQLHGAVSEQVAKEMALGALKNSKAQISISTTGIAGPDMQKISKGIVWIAFASVSTKPCLLKKEIAGSRKQFVNKVAYFVFQELLKFLNQL